MRRTNDYTEFGLWLKVELLKRNLSIREFSKMASLNYRVVSDVMTGRNKSHRDRLEKCLAEYDRQQDGKADKGTLYAKSYSG